MRPVLARLITPAGYRRWGHLLLGGALFSPYLLAVVLAPMVMVGPVFGQALAAIEEAGRTAMVELDRVVRLLNEDDDAADTVPTLTRLDRLLPQTRALGVEVAATVVGQTAALPAAVSQEAYRIVQQALTNAVSHTTTGPVTLRAVVTTNGLELEMNNPITTPAGCGTDRRRRHGHGLRGMRERVTMLNGTMTAAASEGQWRIRVWLPLDPP